MGQNHRERQLLLEVTDEMVKQGLVAGSSGNASLRLTGNEDEDLVLITPSRFRYGRMSPEDLVVVDLAGGAVKGDHLPSSETALHLELYQARADVGAIIHTHSPYSSVAAVAGLPIPPLIDEMVIKVGGRVEVAEYGFPASEELARNACHSLGERNAVLLRNHGLIGVGREPWEALEVCQMVERAAQIFIYASLIGKATPLPSEAVEIQRELFLMQKAAERMNNPGNN